jgi:SAM-dependent methyltransferase
VTGPRVAKCACPADKHVGACLAVVPGSVVVGFLDPGHWSACFGLSYRDLCLYDALTSQRMARSGPGEIRALTGSGGIPANRNKVTRGFLDSTAGEWLFFIDSDMGFERDTVDRLVASADAAERPVLGALCFAGVRDRGAGAAVEKLYGERFKVVPTVYEYVEADDEIGFRPIPDYPRDQVVTVAGTGAACLLIHRDALAKVRAQHGDAWFDPITHPTALKGGRGRSAKTCRSASAWRAAASRCTSTRRSEDHARKGHGVPRRGRVRQATRPGAAGEGTRVRLNLGCGRDIREGWVNIDAYSGPGVDLAIDLDAAPVLPYDDGTVDEFEASHVVEHLYRPLPLMAELWRVAKPGARLRVRVPYGSSDDADEDPTHVRRMFLNSWGYFSQPMYWRADYGYRADWKPVRVTLLIRPEFADATDEEITALVRFSRNVVREMVADLIAVKPAREPRRELQEPFDVVLHRVTGDAQ